MNTPGLHPTLLRTPALGSLLGWQETYLSGDPGDYLITNALGWWTVKRSATVEVVYAGPGPVTVVRSPAPF